MSSNYNYLVSVFALGIVMARDSRRLQPCRTCRTRGMSCDFAQPVCTACRVSGLRCIGVGREAVFVNTTGFRQNKTATIGYRPSPIGRSSLATSSSKSLSQYADQQKFIGFFWSAYLPHGESFPLEANQYTTCGWTNAAQSLGDRVEVMKLAIMANSFCMLGSQHREEVMTKRGHLLFGRALREMRHTLQSFTEDRKDGLIIASRLLTMFMVLFGSSYNDTLAQSQAWESLNAGELAIFLSGKPELYETGVAHQIFVDARLHLFIPNIVSRSQSALYNADWMNVPWSNTPKSPLDEVVDLVAKASMLLDNSKDSATRDANHCTLFTELESWVDQRIPELNVDQFLSGKRREPLAIDLAKAHALMLFWTTCLLLRSAKLFTTPKMEMSSWFDIHVIRYNILRLLVIFFRQEAGWFGVNIALFPLRAVYETLGECPLSPREAKLMASLSNGYKRKEISGFLLSMTHYRSKFFPSEGQITT